jgi:hypothetical protein
VSPSFAIDPIEGLPEIAEGDDLGRMVAAATELALWTTAANNASTLSSLRSIDRWPASMLERSSRSLSMRVIRVAAWQTRSTCPTLVASRVRDVCKSSRPSKIVLSGVRRSCDTIARKSSRVWTARRSASSARLCSVMSVNTDRRPTTAPVWSKATALSSRITIGCPDGPASVTSTDAGPRGDINRWCRWFRNAARSGSDR